MNTIKHTCEDCNGQGTREINLEGDHDVLVDCTNCEGTGTVTEVTNPAKEFVQKVNGLFPGTFPPKSEMDEDAIMGDIDTFNSEDLAA